MNSDDLIKKKLVLGTVQFGLDYGISNTMGRTNINEVNRILKQSKDIGINSLDTARAYGDSEQIIGNSNYSRSFEITTKFIDNPNASINQSLSELKLDFVECLLAHNARNVLDNPKYWDRMLSIKESGLSKKIGFSVNSPNDLLRILDNPGVPDVVQVPYNLLDRRFESYFSELRERSIQIQVRSIFLQGLFFTNINQLETHFDCVKNRLLKLQIEYPGSGILAGNIIGATLQNPLVDKVVIGINTIEQLLMSLKNLNMTSSIYSQVEPVYDDKILMPSYWPKRT